MLHVSLAHALSLYSDPSYKGIVSTTLVLALSLVVKPAIDVAYVEWPATEPMENVLAAIQRAESQHGVVFDPLDEDLWEYPPGGVRLHGMFLSEINGEENLHGASSR